MWATRRWIRRRCRIRRRWIRRLLLLLGFLLFGRQICLFLLLLCRRLGSFDISGREVKRMVSRTHERLLIGVFDNLRIDVHAVQSLGVFAVFGLFGGIDGRIGTLHPVIERDDGQEVIEVGLVVQDLGREAPQ